MSFTTATLTVNSIAIPASQIHGVANILRRENSATVMDVTLIPTPGAQDIDYWRGKDVLLVVDGVTAFVGIVDEPIVDIVYKKITLSCTDNRKEKINTDLAATIETIGFYSDSVFNEVDSIAEQLDQRLQTIPSAVDYTPAGVYALTDINPKAVADITLTGADVYRRTPKLTPASRADLINQINLTFDFRYTRLRHRERSFQIGNNTFCDYMGTLGSLFTKKTEFLSYIESMGWFLNESTVVFEDLPASGNISSCDGPDFAWFNFNDLYATKVNFDALIRFAQTITENFTITVKAPQSITQYGLIEEDSSNGAEVEYDVSAWESLKTYEAPTGLTADANDDYIDQDGTTEFTDAVEAVINIAATRIKKLHRTNYVDFETDLRLDFDLTKTIYLNTTQLQAQGKVIEVEHEISFTNKLGNTRTKIAFSKAQGTQVPDALTAPTRPAVPVVSDVFDDPQIMTLSLFNEGDVVTPDVDDTSRNEQIVTQTATYNIEIQNDTLGVTF